ncbi:MAG: DUF3048 domain-containing protein [Actinomycetota bacterium]
MLTNLRGRSTACALGSVLLVLALVAAACGGDDGGEEESSDATPTTSSTTSTSSTTTTTLPPGPFAPLTGETVDEDDELLERGAVVVKISNNEGAGGSAQDFNNWRGLDQADIVIEERIEIDATRFAAVYHSVLPESVGPIRSGRTSDLELLSNLGGPVLVYSGANPSVTGQLRSLESEGLVTLVVDRGTNVDLVRDTEFRAPDNLFSNLVEIEEKYGEDAEVATALFEYRQAGQDERSAGVDGPGVTVEGFDIVSFVWDEMRGYVRVQDGEIHTTLDETPLVFTNIVVFETEYRPSVFAPGSVDAEIVGSGVVNLLIDGQRHEGTWERESREDAYSFFDVDGEPLLLDPGQTWVTLVPAGSYSLDVTAEIAALVTEGDG